MNAARIILWLPENLPTYTINNASDTNELETSGMRIGESQQQRWTI